MINATITENSPVVLLARVTDATGSLLVSSTVSSILVSVWDRESGIEIVPEYHPLPTAVIHNTLQTDARWTADSIGYNMEVVIAGTYFPEGNTTYQVEVNLTPTNGGSGPIVIPYALQTELIFSVS
jgi:hypothetical protein